MAPIPLGGEGGSLPKKSLMPRSRGQHRPWLCLIGRAGTPELAVQEITHNGPSREYSDNPKLSFPLLIPGRSWILSEWSLKSQESPTGPRFESLCAHHRTIGAKLIYRLGSFSELSMFKQKINNFYPARLRPNRHLFDRTRKIASTYLGYVLFSEVSILQCRLPCDGNLNE